MWNRGRWVLAAAGLFGLFLYGALHLRELPSIRHNRLAPWEIYLYEILFLVMAVVFGAALYFAIDRFFKRPK